jgi:hypothetical protein
MDTLAWGPYRLIPYALRNDPAFADSNVPACAPDNMRAVDWGVDERILRTSDFSLVPPSLRSDIRFPAVIPFPDAEVTGVWVLPDAEGRYFASQAFWHRRSNPSPRRKDQRITADLRVVRTRGVTTPITVWHEGPKEPEAAVTEWIIEPILVAGQHGLAHRFVINPLVDLTNQRAWVEPDAIEWIDNAGMKNICFGWQMTMQDLVAVAESVAVQT